VLFPDFLDREADEVAERLLGCFLIRDLPEGQVKARIVETEAYDELDPASHSYSGPSRRSQVMFGSSGHLYVYFTYGMHYCANVVCGPAGFGSGVLIRAVEPVEGVELVAARRLGVKPPLTTNGPAKLTRALGIDFDLLGHDLRRSPLRLVQGDRVEPKEITKTTRIGISKAVDLERRYYINSSRYISRR